eukprot:886462-Prymnesium_polylepis.1
MRRRGRGGMPCARACARRTPHVELERRLTHVAHARLRSPYARPWHRLSRCLLYTSPSPRDAHES